MTALTITSRIEEADDFRKYGHSKEKPSESDCTDGANLWMQMGFPSPSPS